MQEYVVEFNTNIDFYHDKFFPEKLPFRPMVGDKVPFYEQDKLFPEYPYLEIQSIRYFTFTHDVNQFVAFVCYLGFSKNTHESICNKILNHQPLN